MQLCSATFKLNSQNQEMYVVKDVIVSGAHSIIHNGKLVKVKDYSEAKQLTENYTNLYSITHWTSSCQ